MGWYIRLVKLDSKLDLRILLRKQLKERMKNVDRVAHEQTLLTGHLIDFLKRREGTWAAFMPLFDEPSPLESVKACPHIQWVFPLVEGNDLSFWISNLDTGFVPGAFGILEPDPQKSQRISVSQIDGFLVPGLGFDKNGARLGRGKGFYDRTLQRSPGEKVGLAFSEQVIKSDLPCDPWDVFMDALVTDKEIRNFRSLGEKGE
jgi:5-formyltetrahydrofolate cyclo-ligase